MGHIVFAAPSIARFHLHERVARALRSRGHRVTVLATDPVGFAFYSAQGLPAWQVKPGPSRGLATPLDSFAEQDCLLAGIARPTLSQLTRAVRPLERRLGGLVRFFEVDTPDLVLLHQERGGMHCLLHFLAREFGSRILWTGDGLVPNTMQWDGEGLDGDASVCRRSAQEYRGLAGQEAFLAAVLASLLAGAAPPPLSRCRIHTPDLRARLGAGLASPARGPGLLSALRAWRQALPPRSRPQPPRDLPERPFLAVLLQHPRDPRLCLDAVATWPASYLVRAAAAAAVKVDADLLTVAVLPAQGLPRSQLEEIARTPSVLVHPPSSALLAATTGLGVVTINHPLGVAGLLSGTPVLHTGRSPYSLRGVTTRTTLDLLERDLPGALLEDQPHLRERFLTWLLAQGHLWCWPDFPDHNGINGLVQKIEECLPQDASGAGLHYRPGPVWPLHAESAG